MPKRRRTDGKSSRKRVARRRTRRRLYRRRIGVPRGLFAKSKLVRHKYFSRGTLDAGALGIVVSSTYRANGMYDPYAGAGGHQPHGYDQYGSFYKNWTVVGAKITVLFTPTGSDASDINTTTAMCYLSLNDRTSMGTDHIQVSEDPSTQFAVLQKGKVVRLTRKFSAKRFFRQRLDDQHQGSNSADPQKQAYFHIGISNLASGGDPNNVEYTAMVTYLAVWRNRQEVPSS